MSGFRYEGCMIYLSQVSSRLVPGHWQWAQFSKWNDRFLHVDLVCRAGFLINSLWVLRDCLVILRSQSGYYKSLPVTYCRDSTSCLLRAADPAPGGPARLLSLHSSSPNSLLIFALPMFLKIRGYKQRFTDSTQVSANERRWTTWSERGQNDWVYGSRGERCSCINIWECGPSVITFMDF